MRPIQILTSRVFNMAKDELQHSKSVTTLFKNQGIYNGLLAVFLLYGIFTGNLEVTTIFVLFVIGAAGDQRRLLVLKSF